MIKQLFRIVFVAFLALMAGTTTYAQTGTVQGTVSDPDGEPLIGVSVRIKDANAGVVTDIDGNYTIRANNGQTLVFSYVGFLTHEAKVTGPTMNVTLDADNRQLDEVVVVGYGVQKKSSLTGAISQVKAEDMENRTITSATQALQGKTAGVQIYSGSARPGASPQVRIRGISSNGSCDPLYVVDGRVASDIAGIDPNDIASMEVLKDGASAAIYGAAAGNGVVLITTKKGSGNGKITYDFQFTSQSLGKVPHVMNSEQYIDYYTEAGLISKDIIYNNWDFETNTDWVKTTFENSKMQRHMVAFQAGNDRGSLYLSLSYLNNNGMVAGNSDIYERITGMINASWKIKPWLEVGTNNQIEHYRARSVAEGNEYGSLILSALVTDPLTRPTYTEENMTDEMRRVLNSSRYGYLLSDGNGNYYGISPYVSAENPNPLIMRDRALNENRGYNINGSTYLNLTPVKGLLFTSRLSYRLSASESYGVSFDYYGNSTQKQDYLQVSASAYTPTYYQWENFANYTRDFGKHHAGLMLGMSYSQSRSFGLSGSMKGTGEDGDLGFKKDDPLFWYFAYANATASKSLSGGEASYIRKLAYFGRANYEYDNKYLAQFSLRADAADSSVLPRPKRWGYFPAASLGWVISEESFMEKTRGYLNHLKIRASWGRNGSTASLGGYSYANVIAGTGNYPTGNGYEYLPGYAPSSTGNDDLKWETSEQTNIGVDARLFNGRLSFTADWFNKETKDLIVTGITPSTVVGNTASPVNAGNITNKGFEFELGWTDRIGDFGYSVRGNIATLRNKVTYIHETLKALDGTSFHTYGAITRFEKGHPAWYFYGYEFAGINPETGDPTFVDRNNDGSITDADKTEIGKGMPDFTYGLTLTANWKGLDLIVFGAGSQGNDIYCCLNRSDFTLNKLTYFTEDRWRPNHTNGSMPAAGAAEMDKYMTSTASVFDGSYFKIKQIQLGYTIPQNWTRKAFIDNLRVYCSLEDFFTFTKYKGFDPEVTGVGSALGVDKGSYPNAKKVVVGLNVTF
ncbi:MAG: TonB-dependent receptor [Lachnoclostridium sp.]|nr:TonB-dependent receptor [Lachnoclostridium sp.]